MDTKFLLTIIIISFLLAGCYNNNTRNNSTIFSQTNQTNYIDQSQVNESITKQNKPNSSNDFNKFFFNDIASKNHYTYKGKVWGDNILDQDNENVDSDGNVYVVANLTISQIAKLRRGNIYELDFSINGEKSNTKEKDEKDYLWVTEDKIYDFYPSDSTYSKDFVDENGLFNYLKYAHNIEKNGQLPSTDETEILCSIDNIYYDDGFWKTEIKVKNNSCIYNSANDRNESYKSFVWEVGKGLISYSWDRGASAAGIDLQLVE